MSDSRTISNPIQKIWKLYLNSSFCINFISQCIFLRYKQWITLDKQLILSAKIYTLPTTVGHPNSHNNQHDLHPEGQKANKWTKRKRATAKVTGNGRMGKSQKKIKFSGERKMGAAVTVLHQRYLLKNIYKSSMK